MTDFDPTMPDESEQLDQLQADDSLIDRGVADVLDEGGWRFGGHWTQALNDPARVAAHLTGQMRPATIEASEVFSTQFGHEITLVGEVPAGIDPEYEETRRGWVWRWNAPGPDGDPELVALLGVDSPREISRARKALRQPL